ncbi:MAG: BamA/TamA family outer membrane protein [Gemmatimonadota bacterium]
MCGLATLVLCGPRLLLGQAPDEPWRSIDTPHFRVSFPAPLEALARRAADRAERAQLGLTGLLGWAPEGRTDLVVTDHVDISNGFANVTPWKRITIYARPPVDVETLQYFDDWMELVIAHELAHVFHLDRAGWLGRLLRSVVGRYPGAWPFFPGRSQPQWVIEGIPTLYESTLTDAGRVHGTEHEMLIRVAALEGALESLDRASGTSPNWPGGDRPYVYGSRFFDHVVERYGAEAIPEFVEAAARQVIPFRLNAAGSSAFDAPLAQVWQEWRDTTRSEAESLVERLRAEGPFSEMEAVGESRRQSYSPRVSPDGRWLVYARSDGRSDSQLRRVDLERGSEESLTRTNGIATLSWAPDGAVVFSQLEYVDPYRIRADLYEVSQDRRVRRITHGARLSHPTVHPDGRTIVAVQEGEGGNRLVRVDRSTGTVTPLSAAGPDELWTEPRFSPDGRWLAAGRWLPGARLDVVVMDGDGRVVAEATNDRARDDAPTWSADGRWLVWASDRTGIPNIVAATFDPATGQVGSPLRMTHTAGGFRYPGLAPDGQWLYVSAYHADGWRIERTAFAPEDASLASLGVRYGDGRAAAQAYGDHAAEPVGPYRALSSAWPHYWEPWYGAPLTLGGTRALGAGYGVQTGGGDVVGRHSWAAAARLQTQESRWEGAFTYSFRGLGVPVLGLGVSQTYDAGRLSALRSDSTRATLFTVERERRADVSAEIEQRRWRSVRALTLSAGWVQQQRVLLNESLEPTEEFRLRSPEQTFLEGSATLVASTARGFAFSPSAEEGVTGLVRARRRQATSLADSLSDQPGVDGSFDELIGRMRAYKGLRAPGWGNHVLAVQAAGGWADGPGADDGHFDVGDAAGTLESVSGFELFGGRPRLFPLRGYAAGVRTGSRAWSTSLEYRVPLVEVRRGLGAWPLFLDRVSASLFFDAGNAWGPSEAPFANPRQATLYSTGVELVSDWLPLWDSTLRIRSGVGVPLVEGDGARMYVRVGTAF